MKLTRSLLCAAVATSVVTLVPTAAYGAECAEVRTSGGTKNDGDGGTIDATVSVPAPCTSPDPDNPGPNPGGGDGGDASCPASPVGPLSQVAALWAEANAGATTPTVLGAVEHDAVIANAGVGSQFQLVSSWYRISGGATQVLYDVRCPNQPPHQAWVRVVADANGQPVPQLSAADLLPALEDSVLRRLPTPVPRVGPADEDPDGYAYVKIRTFFWVDEGPGQWEVVSGTASAGGVSVTVQAQPIRMVVDPGDGSKPVVCDGAPVPVTEETYRPDMRGTCNHSYWDASSMAENGETFPVTVSIVWHATWSANTGEGGDLGYVSTTAEPRMLPVAEILSVITKYGHD